MLLPGPSLSIGETVLGLSDFRDACVDCFGQLEHTKDIIIWLVFVKITHDVSTLPEY